VNISEINSPELNLKNWHVWDFQHYYHYTTDGRVSGHWINITNIPNAHFYETVPSLRREV
jgi:hypothetical protein